MQYILLGLLILTGVLVGWYLNKRGIDVPTVPSYKAPEQVDVSDFTDSIDTLALIVFVSASCDTCREVLDVVENLQGCQKIVVNIEDNESLVKKYKIDGIPLTLVIDTEGIVHSAYFGSLDIEKISDNLSSLEHKLSE